MVMTQMVGLFNRLCLVTWHQTHELCKKKSLVQSLHFLKFHLLMKQLKLQILQIAVYQDLLLLIIVSIWNKRVETSLLVIYTLTEDVRQRLLDIIRLVDLICQVLIQKQADQAIYYTICKVKQHQKCFSKIYVEGLDMDNPARDFFINLSENKLVNSAAKRWGLRLGAARVVDGYTIKEMIETIKELNNKGISCTIDNLGEFVFEKSEAIEAKNQILQVIEAISTHQVDAHVSLKPSQLGLDIAYDFTYANLEEI